MNELSDEEIMADLILAREEEEAAEQERALQWEGPR